MRRRVTSAEIDTAGPTGSGPISRYARRADGESELAAELTELSLHRAGVCGAHPQQVFLGGVQTLRSDNKANTFGNGQAKIWYSSAALANLPDDLSAASWNSSSWREEHPKKP